MSAFCLLFTVDLLYTTISLCLDLFHWAKFRQAKVLAIAVWGTPRLVQSLWGLGVLAVWLHALVDFPMQTPALALWVFVLLGGACAQRVPPNKLPWA